MTLNTATFILVTMISPEANGRTARKGGTDKSAVQKSGLPKPWPITDDSTSGIANAQASVSPIESPSPRVNQEIGAQTTNSMAAAQMGSSWPHRRHSNQN